MKYVPTDSIFPNEFQPRKHFDDELLASLADSIAELGVLQPILVRSAGPSMYELVAGERRWRAAQLAGLTEMPVLVRDIDDELSLEHAVVENLHRADLNVLEEGAAYQRLINEFGLSSEQVAVRVGKSRSAVVNTLRLFQLPGSIQRLVVEGAIGAGHARALLGLPDTKSQLKLAQKIKDETLSVRSVEELVRNHKPLSPAGGGRQGVGVPSSKLRPSALLEVEQVLADQLSTRVSAVLAKQGPGRLTIEFADLEDLERIFSELSGRPGT